MDNLLTRIHEFLPQFLAALPIVLGIMIGTMVLNLLLGRAIALLAHRTNLNQDDILPIRHVLRWVLRIVATILILSVLGFQLGGIWAMISTILGLIAIGFVAVWSMLSNTSATMLILFLQPYQIGDDIEFPGEPTKGRVIDLNFFFTTLVDHEGQLLQIPNNLFFQKTLKRRPNEATVRLAFQLNNPTPAKVALPPAPTPGGADATSPRPPNPLMQLPDPKTMQPRSAR